MTYGGITAHKKQRQICCLTGAGVRLSLGLDRRRRMGEGSASEMPPGDSCGTGGFDLAGHGTRCAERGRTVIRNVRG